MASLASFIPFVLPFNFLNAFLFAHALDALLTVTLTWSVVRVRAATLFFTVFRSFHLAFHTSILPF
jgi:hypothetical protein